MAERIKKHQDIILALGIGLILTAIGLWGFIGKLPLTSTVSAATQSEISVTATVQEYMTLTVNTTTVVLGGYLIDTNGTYNIASSTDITVGINTNSLDGYRIMIKDLNNGLYNAGAGQYIQLATATGTVATGTDYYGVQATSSIITAFYKYATSTNIIGRASTTDAYFASSSVAATTTLNSYMQIKAACAVGRANGDYTDTIYLTGYSTP